MADTPDTPDTPTADDAKPAPRRRVSPRKTATTPGKPRAVASRGSSQRGVVAQAEDAVSKAATAAKDAVTSTADKAVKAVKPRASSRGAARSGTRPAASTRTGATTTRGAAAKRATGTTKRSTGKKATGGKSSLDKATEKVGGKWGAASIIGGVAATGAAVAALLTLRGSSKPAVKPTQPGKTAHQPDGTDSSKSFQAGIADENTIPDKV